jgi:predicted DNA binding protein
MNSKPPESMVQRTTLPPSQWPRHDPYLISVTDQVILAFVQRRLELFVAQAGERRWKVVGQDVAAKALNDERDRRNGHVQLERSTQAHEEPRRPAPINRKPAGVQTSKSGLPPLTQTWVRAIREAIKAGVKPRTVARQFGISLSALQKALSDKSG